MMWARSRTNGQLKEEIKVKIQNMPSGQAFDSGIMALEFSTKRRPVDARTIGRLLMDIEGIKRLGHGKWEVL